ncbi:MAG: TrkA family potassium uptake protein [Polyangiaceae bacterium]|nr:TrkA family potassium uptake protein [Polyangiaceae bacterium]MCW5789093.1 TrkA family potassium uptake protein [Polyangiaceae bacterium]
MNKQVMVVGLGHFGMAVARALAERGTEVLAVDRDPQRVRTISPVVAEALCFDATAEELLARTAPGRRDVCICAIGDESTEGSIICTALLKQMGARRLIARANNDLHGRILKLVGADMVVNPERDFGERFANLLIHDRVLGETPLGASLVLTEFEVPKVFVGRNLIELSMPSRYGISVVALRRAGSTEVSVPDPRAPFQAGDVLLAVAPPDAVNDLLERV